MQYPLLSEIQTVREVIDTFGGYNHNPRIGEAEFYDMENMTSSFYPTISPRKTRGEYVSAENPQGIIAKDMLCYIDGVNFVAGETTVNMSLMSGQKQLVSMGAYVIILPDKKYINTLDTEDRGNIEFSFVMPRSSTAWIDMCDSSGEELTVLSTIAPPDDTSVMWMDNSSNPPVLKKYFSETESWMNVTETYIKISSPGIAHVCTGFDNIKLNENSVLNDEYGLKTSYEIHDVFIDSEQDGKNDYIIVKGVLGYRIRYVCDEHYYCFIDVYKYNGTSSLNEPIDFMDGDPLIVRNEMPDLDYIIESGNRLWGCRYDAANKINEIYASKLGDFKNWNSFSGLSTDSYAVSCGTDGKWTGAVTYYGYPLFFKENYIYKVYGDYPSNFQLQITSCRGVQDGCAHSLAIVNEALFYKSRDGVCIYDGSLPSVISAALGTVSYDSACGGRFNNKYYISMRNTQSEKYSMFVYDAANGLWHREDGTHAAAFASYRDDLYYIDADLKKIMTVNGTGTPQTEPVEWYCLSGALGLSVIDKKYISRLLIRMSLDIGTVVRLYIQYDSSGDWINVGTVIGTSLRSFAVPIRPRRCDHFQLKITGKGGARIFSISKTIEQGSDM